MKYVKWFFYNVDIIGIIISVILIVLGIGLINGFEKLTLIDCIGIFLINAGYYRHKGLTK